LAAGCFAALATSAHARPVQANTRSRRILMVSRMILEVSTERALCTRFTQCSVVAVESGSDGI
jgi:hypothetical protein